MEKEPIRVAQVIGKWLGGGVESVVMNYYRYIDKSKIQFDFICDSDSTNIPYDEIKKLGGRVILVPPYQKVFKYQKELKKIFKENNYKIVHSHINTLSVFPLHAAKCAKVPVRIAHSHSTTNKKEWKKNVIKNILKPFSKIFATDYFACSEHAGKWLYGKKIVNNKKFYIVNNAVDMNRFLFNDKKRENIRKKMGIDDCYVIGHIGRFTPQKNHEFLINILYELKKEMSNIKLILIGDGMLEKEIRKNVANLRLKNNVIFLGVTNNVGDYLQAMDLFVFPSLYEGLGMVAVEAQINDLYVLASTEVPLEARISNKIEFLTLNKDLWKQRIIDLKMSRKKKTLKLSNYDLFDIKEQAVRLEKKYEEVINYGNNKRWTKKNKTKV